MSTDKASEETTPEETTPDSSPQKSFADFVKEAPTVAEAFQPATVTLSGMVLQSESEGAFILLLANGQAIELVLDAVHSYQVISEEGSQRVVELQVLTSALQSLPQARTARSEKPVVNDKSLGDTQSWKDVNGDGGTYICKDVVDDGTLASKDVVDDGTLASKDVVGDSTLASKDVVADGTHGWKDFADDVTYASLDVGVNKNVIKDVADELPPAEGSFARTQGGMIPFILATPHHAPQAAVMAQRLAGAGRNAFTLKEAAGDVPKAAGQDPIAGPMTFKELAKDPLWDPMTFKEMAKDPLLDPMTWKEMIKESIQDPLTWVEAIDQGTLVENIGPGTGWPFGFPPMGNRSGRGF